MFRAGNFTVLATIAVILIAGCTGKKSQTVRPQAADEPIDRNATANIGEKTVPSNVEPIAVSAVGLVWKLPGTGSIAAGEWRPMLERDLRKKKLNPKQFLDDPNKTCSLVLVTASIPPGARKGDPVDIDVVLPRGSSTTSLKNGVLFECDLVTTEESANVRDQMIRGGADVAATPVTGNTLLVGKALVRAEGPLVAGSSDNRATLKASFVQDVDSPEPVTYTMGKVWGGGRVLEDRPYWLVLNEKDRSSRLAMEVAARLNAIFQPAGDARSKVANAVTKDVITVNVPSTYRLNHMRFLLVSRQIPLTPAGPDSLYRKKLEQELLEADTAVIAAIKLEALGAESTQPLRVGLQSTSPWVRFASAEALAYLGNTAGVGELARLCEQHAALRTHCLTALATLDDGVSTDRLVELMAHPDAGLRYGAFVALRSANENHTALNGKHVKKTFWLHQVAPDSQAMIHLTSNRRSEIVLFGNAGQLVPPFSLPLGRDYVVSAKASDTDVTVTHIAQGPEGAQEVKVLVKPNLAAVLNAMGEMGAGYSEAIELVRKLDTAKVVAGAVILDAAPRGMPTAQLAQLARTDANLERANVEVAQSTQGNDILQAGYDLPSDAEAVKEKPTADVPQLNRNPGRIFSSKKHPSEPDAEVSPPAPAGPTAKSIESSLARNPGKLFGK